MFQKFNLKIKTLIFMIIKKRLKSGRKLSTQIEK